MEQTIVIRNAKFVETSFGDGSKQLVGTVRGDSFVNLDIPTKPNPRQFTGDANPNYKAMKKTLQQEPEMFARKNSAGITMFATSCDANGDGSYTITFRNNDGIANGGHTYHALKRHGRDNSYVKVTIEIGLHSDRIQDVAEALNLNKKLQFYSLQNKAGSFDWHKNSVGESVSDISYHEGDSGVIEIKEAISFLHLFKYDTESKTINILENVHMSEKRMNHLLNSVAKGNLDLNSSLQWIAKDVHEAAKYAILNENYMIQLKPLETANGQNWTKSRGVGESKQKGLMKGLALLLVAGLANVGTELNRNNIVQWKEGYRTEAGRKAFLDALFTKVFDIVSVEDGASSDIIRREYVAQKVMKHASLIAARLKPSKKRVRKVS